MKDLQALECCLSTVNDVLRNDRLTEYKDFITQQKQSKKLENALRGCKNCVDAFVRSIEPYEERVSQYPGTNDHASAKLKQWLNSDEIREFKRSIAVQAHSLDILLDDLVANVPTYPSAEQLRSITESPYSSLPAVSEDSCLTRGEARPEASVLADGHFPDSHRKEPAMVSERNIIKVLCR